MMGSNNKPQDEFFYSFNLEDVVPEDHLLRSIDRFLDFSDLREHLAPYYSHTDSSTEHEGYAPWRSLHRLAGKIFQLDTRTALGDRIGAVISVWPITVRHSVEYQPDQRLLLAESGSQNLVLPAFLTSALPPKAAVQNVGVGIELNVCLWPKVDIRTESKSPFLNVRY